MRPRSYSAGMDTSIAKLGIPKSIGYRIPFTDDYIKNTVYLNFVYIERVNEGCVQSFVSKLEVEGILVDLQGCRIHLNVSRFIPMRIYSCHTQLSVIIQALKSSQPSSPYIIASPYLIMSLLLPLSPSVYQYDDY